MVWHPTFSLVLFLNYSTVNGFDIYISEIKCKCDNGRRHIGPQTIGTSPLQTGEWRLPIKFWKGSNLYLVHGSVALGWLGNTASGKILILHHTKHHTDPQKITDDKHYERDRDELVNIPVIQDILVMAVIIADFGPGVDVGHVVVVWKVAGDWSLWNWQNTPQRHRGKIICDIKEILMVKLPL